MYSPAAPTSQWSLRGLVVAATRGKMLLLPWIQSFSLIVNTTLGPIKGTTETTSQGGTTNVFRGVPFAASTGGANRWMPPQPRAPRLELLGVVVDRRPAAEEAAPLREAERRARASDDVAPHMYHVKSAGAGAANLRAAAALPCRASRVREWEWIYLRA